MALIISCSCNSILSWSLIMLFFYILSIFILCKKDKIKKIVTVFTLGGGIGLLIAYIIFMKFYNLNKINVTVIDSITKETLCIRERIDQVYSEGNGCISFVDKRKVENIFYEVETYEINGRNIVIYTTE